MTAANGRGTYTWNTTGVAPGTYYLAGYMWDGSKPTYSHLKQAITIQAAAAPQVFTMNGPDRRHLSGRATRSTSSGRPADVVPDSTISLCYDSDKYINGNEHWIEIDSVTAANGSGTYDWNTSGVPTGTYYLAGYMWDGSKPTYSHLKQTITIGAPLTLAAPQGPAPASLPESAVLDSQSELTPIVDEAIQRWPAPLPAPALAGVSVQIADLPGMMLGETVGNKILIDRDAAGYGWFIDPTPADDVEFADVLGPYDSGRRRAAPPPIGPTC